MPRKKLKLQLTGFTDGGGKLALVELLRELYDVNASSDPDLLIFSSRDQQHYKYTCTKIYYTAEKDRPNFDICDYAFSYEETNERNFKFPNFINSPYFYEFVERNASTRVAVLRGYPKTRFCNFMYSNPVAPERIEFCRALERCRHVDCPGRVLNNMERVSSKKMQREFPESKSFARFMTKIHFLKYYRFTIAFENSSQVGYTTEKLYHPLLAGSVPIYWGDPRASDYFNPRAYINAHDFSSWEELADYVVKVDSDPALYEQYRSAAPVVEGSKLEEMTRDKIKARLRTIVDSIGEKRPISQTPQFARERISRLVRNKIKSALSRCRRRVDKSAISKYSM